MGIGAGNRRMRRAALLSLGAMVGAVAVCAVRHSTRGAAAGSPSVRAALRRYGRAVRRELGPICTRAGVPWPPARLRLLAFKQERVLEVWAAGRGGAYVHLATYPILAASGGPGPKRREGDGQVPEGDYELTALNPASRYHLSVRVDYPNAEDVRCSRLPRGRMGGDIYVHGNAVSIGCIAIGDRAIERVFCLAAWADPSDRRILIAPVDFRRGAAPPPADEPWVRALYARLAARLAAFPPP